MSRKPEFGGEVTYATYEELEASYAKEELHPGDFKLAVESYINRLLDPIRAEFNTPELKYVKSHSNFFITFLFMSINLFFLVLGHSAPKLIHPQQRKQ